MSEKTTYIGEVMSRAAWRHDYIYGREKTEKEETRRKQNYGGILIDFITDQNTQLRKNKILKCKAKVGPINENMRA